MVGGAVGGWERRHTLIKQAPSMRNAAWTTCRAGAAAPVRLRAGGRARRPRGTDLQPEQRFPQLAIHGGKQEGLELQDCLGIELRKQGAQAAQSMAVAGRSEGSTLPNRRCLLPQRPVGSAGGGAHHGSMHGTPRRRPRPSALWPPPHQGASSHRALLYTQRTLLFTYSASAWSLTEPDSWKLRSRASK